MNSGSNIIPKYYPFCIFALHLIPTVVVALQSHRASDGKCICNKIAGNKLPQKELSIYRFDNIWQ